MYFISLFIEQSGFLMERREFWMNGVISLKNKIYSIWSCVLSILGFLFIAMSYNIVPPNNVIKFLLFGGIGILVLSIILSFIAIKRRENGKLRYFTLWFIPLVVVIVTIVPIILMAIFGFNEP